MMLTKLCLYFLLCERVKSSIFSVLQNETLINSKTDDFLGRFLVEFKSTCLYKSDLRYTTVIGASRNHLEQVQPLLVNHPNIWCSDAKDCDYAGQFSRENFVIVFVEDLGENYTDIFSRCEECSLLFLCDRYMKVDDVFLVLNQPNFQQYIAYLAFAEVENNVIRLYSYLMAPNCSVKIGLLIDWRPGVSLHTVCRYSTYGLHDLNGCPVSISTLKNPPKMIIKENDDGSLTTAGGREGKLLWTLAEKFNFTILLRYPSLADQLRYSRKGSIINDVASGISDIGIGRLRPTTGMQYAVVGSVPYDQECITWGVPRTMNWSNDIMWVEFPREMWALVGLVFVISCIMDYTIQSNVLSINGPRTNPDFAKIFLDVIAIHLGSPVVHVVTCPRGRFMLTTVVLYALVITTAYKTSLALILETDKGISTIVDTQGIIDANLNVGGSLYDYNVLQDQVNDSILGPIFLDRYVINNDLQILNQLMLGRNYAFLGRRSILYYKRQMLIKSRKSVPFDILNNCVLTHHTVMAYRKFCLFRKPMDEVIQALTESGVFQHWDNEVFDTGKVLEGISDDNYFQKHGSQKLKNAFIFYFGSITVSILTFFMELMIHRFSYR